jgi:hypothetical protein
MHDRFVLGHSDVDWKRWNHVGGPDYDAPAPRHDAYWVSPGRVLAGPYPGAKYGVEAEGKLDDFLDLGVTCFIDLTEEGEGKLEPYAALLRKLAGRRGVEVTHLRMPIRDVDVAPRWRMRAIQDAITRARSRAGRLRPLLGRRRADRHRHRLPPRAERNPHRRPGAGRAQATAILDAARTPRVPGDERAARHGPRVERRLTQPRLRINHPADLDWLIALEFGRVETVSPGLLGRRVGWLHCGTEGPIVGFKVLNFSAFDAIDDEH